MSFNLSIVGDHGVGKTSFLKRYSEGVFYSKYIPTEKTQLTDLIFSISSKEKLRVKCFDGLYTINSQAAILMFDLTSRSSFENIEKIYQELISLSHNIPIALLGNKCDMKDDIVINRKEISEIAKKYHLPYFDVSSKACINVEEPFLYLLKTIIGWNEVKLILP
jgi:small GTP-binding protein